jgi:hypothetical protein
LQGLAHHEAIIRSRAVGLWVLVAAAGVFLPACRDRSGGPSDAPEMLTLDSGMQMASDQLLVLVKPGTARWRVDLLALSLEGRVEAADESIGSYTFPIPRQRTPEALIRIVKKVDAHPIVSGTLPNVRMKVRIDDPPGWQPPTTRPWCQ